MQRFSKTNIKSGSDQHALGPVQKTHALIQSAAQHKIELGALCRRRLSLTTERWAKNGTSMLPYKQMGVCQKLQMVAYASIKQIFIVLGGNESQSKVNAKGVVVPTNNSKRSNLA